MEKINIELVISVLVVLILGYIAGYHFGIGNQSPRFGTGFPKNCRAFISETTHMYFEKYITATDTIGKINRGCGLYGTLWKER